MWLLILWSCGFCGTDALSAESCEAVETVSVTGDPLEGLDTCYGLTEAFYDEQSDLRTCTTDADCGQLLERWTCGCTRATVLACTADPGRLLAIGDALDVDCEGWMPDGSCDCPEEQGLLCTDGQCGWNYTDG